MTSNFLGAWTRRNIAFSPLMKCCASHGRPMIVIARGGRVADLFPRFRVVLESFVGACKIVRPLSGPEELVVLPRVALCFASLHPWLKMVWSLRDPQSEESGLRQVEESGLRQVEESDLRQVEESGLRQVEESGLRQVEESGARQVEESGARQVRGIGCEASRGRRCGAGRGSRFEVS